MIGKAISATIAIGSWAAWIYEVIRLVTDPGFSFLANFIDAAPWLGTQLAVMIVSFILANSFTFLFFCFKYSEK